MILRLILLGLFQAAPDTTASPSPSAKDSLVVGRRPDSLRVRPLAETSLQWSIPPRSAAPGTALDQAFRDGQSDLPWRAVAELDGMWETWSRWPGLRLDPAPQRLAWDGPSLAGAGDAGPFSGRGIEKAPRAGLEGRQAHRIVPLPVATDTPSTALEFYRGALASYRFGMEFNRAVTGPWAVSVAMETRSAQSRHWVYRDQIQDMFQGSFGRGRGDLPSHGRSAGQDDVQWQGMVSRGTENSRLDLGMTWTDLRRGQPDPQKEWNDADRPVFDASQARSGFYARWNGLDPSWRGSAMVRDVSESWQWAALPVVGAPRMSEGSIDHLQGEGEIARRQGGWEWGPRVQWAVRSGSQRAPYALPTVSEDQERGALVLAWKDRDWQAHGEGGWTRLSTSGNRILGAWDGQAGIGWGDSSSTLRGKLRWDRSNRMPSEGNLRADPLLQTIHRHEVRSEATDLAQASVQLRTGSFLTLEAGGAFQSILDAWQPLAVPVEGRFTHRQSAMVNENAGSVLGWSGEAGLQLRRFGWHARSLWGYSQRSLPGQSPSVQDPRWATLHSRSNLGWSGDLLDGRVQLAVDADVRVWGERLAWMPVSDSLAKGVLLEDASQFDLETRVGIKTFVIQWRLENIFDVRQMPAPGWNPLGIRAGWGVTWSFGG